MNELLLGNDLLVICIIRARDRGHHLLLNRLLLLLLLDHGGFAKVVCSNHLLLLAVHHDLLLVRGIGKRLHLHVLVRLLRAGARAIAASVRALLAVHTVDAIIHSALVTVLVDSLRLVVVVDGVLGQDFFAGHV